MGFGSGVGGDLINIGRTASEQVPPHGLNSTQDEMVVSCGAGGICEQIRLLRIEHR